MAELLPIIVAILILGIGAQLVSWRLRVPSVLFLILIGLAIGDSGLGLVTMETFGDGLQTVVGVSVAVIVFDGAFALRAERIRSASQATLRLVVIGAAITLVGTAVAVRFLLGASWPLSFLVGSLLVATGPTVITPIMEVVHLREHVAAALETEGIINDVTAAVAAIVVYELYVLGNGSLPEAVVAFGGRLGVGLLVGGGVAVGIYALLRADPAPTAPQSATRFLTLVAALGAFAGAEVIIPEAGIAAAATAGIILGNLDVPHRETMETFATDITLIVLSFVFISLAALIDVAAIQELGFAGLALVFVFVLVIRPLVIAISTLGLQRFTTGERLFLSAVAPRGIIPASVATLFAIELATDGDPTAAQTLMGAVFVVIFATVVLEAGLARQIGDLFDVQPMRTIIVGGGRVGRALATRLEDRGEFVVLVERDIHLVETARAEGFTVRHGDGTDVETLTASGIEDAKIVVAATGDDDHNLLVCQLARSKFGVERVYSRVNDPANVDAFDTLDVTAIDASMATAFAIDNEIERPALAHWMTELGEGHDVQEIVVTADDLVGRSIAEVNAEIPDGCIVAVIARGDETFAPSGDDELNHGDRVTFIGSEDAVKRAARRFHPIDHTT